ncbi:MAG: hypothetical protein R3B70_46515 [Polyangiaceae bacterium]
MRLPAGPRRAAAALGLALGPGLAVLAAALGHAPLGCTPASPRAEGPLLPPAPRAVESASPAPPPPDTAVRETPSPAESASPEAPPKEIFDPSLPVEVRVPGDLVALVAHGPTGNHRAIVYLHGVCGDVSRYQDWAEAAIHHGTVIAVRGDDACKEPGRYKWGDSVARTDRRLVAAVRAVGAVRAAPLDTESIVLVGYSQGSARAEALLRTFPARYNRAVLVAGPREHSAASFRETLSVAIVAGQKDLKTHLRDAAEKARKAGAHAHYFELPGARHGEYGPEAARVMGEALSWALGEEGGDAKTP